MTHRAAGATRPAPAASGPPILAGDLLSRVHSSVTTSGAGMRLLDLFCGAGGAAMGYHRAGFDEIVGVDIKPQPRYPFTFVQADAMTYPLEGFDAIHASPPCEGFSFTRFFHKEIERHDMLTPTRTRLDDNGTPWVIENVTGAPMRRDFTLCGTQFGHRRLQRHRHFEVSWPIRLELLHPCDHSERAVSVCGHSGPAAGRRNPVSLWREVMGITWMSRDEIAKAIPPAYTEFIGKQLISYIRRKEAQNAG